MTLDARLTYVTSHFYSIVKCFSCPSLLINVLSTMANTTKVSQVFCLHAYTIIIVSTCFNVRATDSRTWCSLICSILNPLWRNMTFVDQDCLHTRYTEGIACGMLCHLFLASICLLWGDHSQSTVLLPKTTIKIHVYCFKWAMLHPQTDLLVSF